MLDGTGYDALAVRSWCTSKQRCRADLMAAALKICDDCEKIPASELAPCSEELVCGLDAETYGSACLAECQGIDILHTGSCNSWHGACSHPADVHACTEEHK